MQYLDFVQFLASRSRGSALQFFSFFAKFIAEGTIYEQKKEKRASDSLGDAVTKYKVEDPLAAQNMELQSYSVCGYLK